MTIYKKRCFTKSIKMRPKQLIYIKEETKRLGYRTYAGTLDRVVNFYKKEKFRKQKKLKG